jgi:hypothetical protein
VEALMDPAVIWMFFTATIGALCMLFLATEDDE